ncbi:cyanoexosortase B system-associated protein [Microcystis aeruginosa EAWAG127a]|uniref:Cyanoexosortase B system-associated protein n=1 Tax=Microcystis aeruginosa EAWAG127a TaxID=2529855 RepID=A0A5J5LTN2_MICAE|nr:cyanoexosortase B system-associated protein [Microcystis aeruginosa]KAB0241002.1 cyanoexosortase B system-associated protein [Microcystis aeruginosa EAWAG127a]MDB9415175.1 cyanoexosortase B system-associated protein [Microcystis aeruginosa CS-556/03]
MISQKIPDEVTLVLHKVKKKLPGNYLLLLYLLLFLILGGILPNLISGHWSWVDQPRIGNIQKMRTLQESGINFSNLKTIDQQQGQIGEGAWSIQVVESPDDKKITVLLRPQLYYKNQPGVEWSDISSISRWNQGETTELSIPTQSGGKVTARFYQAWTQSTFVVVQWYAWLGGGHYDPSVWYWLDQWAQLKRQRVPWIAVSLLIPLDPTKELQTLTPFALNLAGEVQSYLEQNVLSQLTSVPETKKEK